MLLKCGVIVQGSGVFTLDIPKQYYINASPLKNMFGPRDKLVELLRYRDSSNLIAVEAKEPERDGPKPQ